jgi:hypothetical protein
MKMVSPANVTTARMSTILVAAYVFSAIDAFVLSSQTITNPLVGPFVDQSSRLDHDIPSSSSSSTTSSLYASTMDNDVKPKTRKNNYNDMPSSSSSSLGDRIANSGMASAAVMATAAVNVAVSMKTLQAPDVDNKSYIVLDDSISNNNQSPKELDEEGLPLVYDKDLIQAYWSKERGALNQRWTYFVGKAVPFLTKLTTLWIRDGKITDEEIPALSRQARMDLQDLGPTFIKVK